MKIVVISHAMIQESSRRRWQLLADDYPCNVTIIVPAHWESRWFGELHTFNPIPFQKDRFQVIPKPIFWAEDHGEYQGTKYLFRSLDCSLRQLRPDLIHVSQESCALVLQQLIFYRNLWVPQAKISIFSYENISLPVGTWQWENVCRYVDLVIAGNLETKALFQKAGYPGEIVVQTEIGVDETAFKPDDKAREKKRIELGLSGFVVGFVGRLIPEKGIFDLASTAHGLPKDIKFLYIGDGPQKNELKNFFANMPDRLKMTGFIPIEKMPEYIRLPDVLVLPSQTNSQNNWKEQFGLVLAQAMCSQIPVIGSSSGAIPEVIGDAGLIFPEKNVQSLQDCINRLYLDHSLAESLAQCGFERAMSLYSASGLAKQTYQLFQRKIQ